MKKIKESVITDTLFAKVITIMIKKIRQNKTGRIKNK